MKTIKLSAFALACAMLVYSCTKESPSLLEEGRLSSSETLSAAQGGGNGNGNGNSNAGTNGQNAINPMMLIEFNPSPAIAGSSVTVTGKFDPASADAAPTCGKVQLMEETAPGVWTPRGAQTDISSSVQSVSYTFTPTLVGDDVYTFKLHYIAGNCAGYSEAKSGIFYLDVISPCTFNLTGSGVSAVPSTTPGFYDFKVKYTVNTCTLQFNKFKIQGGLTNGSSNVSASGGIGTQGGWIPGTSTNQVINWNELESTPGLFLPNATRTYEITFTKAYSGSGPITVTGNWSATAELNGVVVGTSSFAPIVFN